MNAQLLRSHRGLPGQFLHSSATRINHLNVSFRRLPKRSPLLVTAAQSTAAAPSAIQLPTDLRNATAVLSVGDTDVYILGISHVSKVSLGHIRDLISLVRPNQVFIELCKDRTGLLVDADTPPPQCWHTNQVKIAGYSPENRPGWPTEQELLQLLKCKNSNPVSASEIEDDVITLLSTGLFGSARPVAKPPGLYGAPAFVVDEKKGGKLSVVAPLSEIEFLVTERKLPQLTDFQIEFETPSKSSVTQEKLDEIKAAALASANGITLAAVLSARGAFQKESLEIVGLSGLETGKVEVRVADAKDGSIVVKTGLESTALNGQGIGILPFQRQTRPGGKVVSAGALQFMMNMDAANKPSAQNGAAGSKVERMNVAVEPWSKAELAQVENSNNTVDRGFAGSFASFLTKQYGTYQSAAGRAVGIGPGAAWQVALESAAAVGAQQVLLGDRPASVTGLRLAQGIWQSSAPSVLGSVPAALAGAIITSNATAGLDNPIAALAAPIFAVILPLVAALWPIAAPLLEIKRFSEMSAAQIEEAVKLKEPLQVPGVDASTLPPVALFGEDALIKWGGAMEPIINERDEFMARSIVAATGQAAGYTPAFVSSSCDSSTTSDQWRYRYAMPAGGDASVCPVGHGDGRFELKSTNEGRKKLVAVVGTAHVRGMMKAWPKVSKPGANLELTPFVKDN